MKAALLFPTFKLVFTEYQNSYDAGVALRYRNKKEILLCHVVHGLKIFMRKKAAFCDLGLKPELTKTW